MKLEDTKGRLIYYRENVLLLDSGCLSLAFCFLFIALIPVVIQVFSLRVPRNKGLQDGLRILVH